MSISSILATNFPGPPSNFRNTSFGDTHAAEAAQVPSSDFTTSPVNVPTTPATAETFSAGVQVYTTQDRNHANEDYKAIKATAEDGFPNAALTNSSTTAGQDKGKGKDPELYNTKPTEDSNAGDNHVDRLSVYNAAESLLQLWNELDSVSGLLDLGTEPCECNDCTSGDVSMCANADCLKEPWRSPPVSPSPVAKDESDHLYSSESEDEGSLPFTAPKGGFGISCHGNHFQLFAREGNAVLDLPRLRHDNLEFHDQETQCRRCHVFQGSIHRAYYGEGYNILGCNGFEREDTLPLDDDVVDSLRHKEYGAAEYHSEKNNSKMLSRPPKLSKKTIKRLKLEKLQWRPEPDHPIATPSASSVSSTDAIEPIRLPVYAKSNTPGSINPSAEQLANDCPSSSGQRSSYTDRRSGESCPLASDFVDLTKTISLPSPSTRQARQLSQKTAVTPSPLKQVENAVESDQTSPLPGQHNLRTTRPVPKRPSGTQSRHGTRSSTKAFSHRAELTNEFVHIGVRKLTPPKELKGSVAITEAGPSTPKKRTRAQNLTPPEEVQKGSVAFLFAEAGPSTPKKRKANSITTTNIEAALLPTPPTLGRKRKAATQAVEVEEQPPSQQKKGKGKAVMTPEQARMREVLDAVEGKDGNNNPWRWYVSEEGHFVRRKVEVKIGRAKARAKAKIEAEKKRKSDVWKQSYEYVPHIFPGE
ncbi:MAG: hypothetical protein Q9175_005917 [Cornicularia normoerica]